jgi:hypothetical protein
MEVLMKTGICSIYVTLTATAFLLFTHETQAAIISVEPDDFSRLADLTNAVPGVTLSVAKTTGQSTSTLVNKVVALGDTFPPVIASTGSFVFGRQIEAFFPDGSWFQSGIDFVPAIFRADFATPTDFVSIDIIRSGSANTGFLKAFDSSGQLLDTFTANLGDVGMFTNASITRSTPDIAYILAAGFPSGGPPFNVVALDNLRFNAGGAPEPVPEPSSTLSFLALGTLGAASTLKRKLKPSKSTEKEKTKVG